MPGERSPRRIGSEIRDRDRDRNRRPRLQDAMPLKTSPRSDAKLEAKDAGKTSDRKPKELGETTNPSGVSRSRSFTQHDNRGTAGQDDRRSGRRLTSEHGRWKDSKDEGHATHRRAISDVNEKKDKPEARGGDGRVWRHDRFFEMDKNADQPTKKRRQFREEKLPPQLDPVGHAAAEPSKDMHRLNSTGNVDRREGDRFHRPSERNDYGRTFVKSRSFVDSERGERTDMPPRERPNGGDYDGRYRARDMSRGRQGFQSSGGRVEKWKHDLYYEANSSPIKNEEDPITKVEALLSL